MSIARFLKKISEEAAGSARGCQLEDQEDGPSGAIEADFDREENHLREPGAVPSESGNRR
jgi:hypothetical protein